MASRLLLNLVTLKKNFCRNYAKQVNIDDYRWKIFIVKYIVPSYIIASIKFWTDNPHHRPRPVFRPYDHLRIRHTPFPWGDGTKSLFHNPRKNALPDGYEAEE